MYSEDRLYCLPFFEESSLELFRSSLRETLISYWLVYWIFAGFTNRPQKLFVVINPVGGKKKANEIYDKKVSPLFYRAGIRVTKSEVLSPGLLPDLNLYFMTFSLFQTDYKGHGTNLVQEAASGGLLKECDGVVAVGGDGLVNEVATGLFILSSKTKGFNPHDPEIDLPETQVRLGIIPSKFLSFLI